MKTADITNRLAAALRAFLELDRSFTDTDTETLEGMLKNQNSECEPLVRAILFGRRVLNAYEKMNGPMDTQDQWLDI